MAQERKRALGCLRRATAATRAPRTWNMKEDVIIQTKMRNLNSAPSHSAVL